MGAGKGGQWDASSPLPAVEEPQGSEDDKQHEAHGGDSKEHVQAARVLLLWGSESRVRGQQRAWLRRRVEFPPWERRRSQAGRRNLPRAGELRVCTWAGDVEGHTVGPGAVASQRSGSNSRGVVSRGEQGQVHPPKLGVSQTGNTQHSGLLRGSKEARGAHPKTGMRMPGECVGEGTHLS